jgi:hypothetical protein
LKFNEMNTRSVSIEDAYRWQLFATGGVPYPNRLVVGRRGQVLAIWAVDNESDNVGVSLQTADLLATTDIPQCNCAGSARGCEVVSVGTECDAGNATRLTFVVCFLRAKRAEFLMAESFLVIPFPAAQVALTGGRNAFVEKITGSIAVALLPLVLSQVNMSDVLASTGFMSFSVRTDGFSSCFFGVRNGRRLGFNGAVPFAVRCIPLGPLRRLSRNSAIASRFARSARIANKVLTTIPAIRTAINADIVRSAVR